MALFAKEIHRRATHQSDTTVADESVAETTRNTASPPLLPADSTPATGLEAAGVVREAEQAGAISATVAATIDAVNMARTAEVAERLRAKGVIADVDDPLPPSPQSPASPSLPPPLERAGTPAAEAAAEAEIARDMAADAAAFHDHTGLEKVRSIKGYLSSPPLLPPHR